MPRAASRPFGLQLKALREAAGFTQEELATVADLSVHAVSALERGERRRPQLNTVRALCAALDLTSAVRDDLLAAARVHVGAAGEPRSVPPPLPLTTLVGRDADLRALRRWLGDPATRLVTLVGPGGVGKTRLALQLAHVLAAERAGGVVFVSLAAVRDSAFVAAAIGEAFGLADGSAVDLPRRVRAACEEQPMMLVLDNFEHLLDAAPLVAELLTTVPVLRALVTSRASLRLRGEREYVVGPLALSGSTDAMTPEDLARSPAVQLFLDRVADVRPDFSLTAVNAPTIAAICRRLDALPLALELAARWMKVLSAEDLLRRLDTDVVRSADGGRDLPERQRTMNATVEWSYQLLEPNEQRAFRRFGALPGLFPIDAAADVLAGGVDRSDTSDEAIRMAATLIDKNLLVRAETSSTSPAPLYYMLETVRAYAALALSAEGERDDAIEGLVRYCRREAACAADELVGPAQCEWLDHVHDDIESYRAVLAWLLARDRAVEAGDIASSLLFFWVVRSQAEGLRWYEQVLSLPALPRATECRVLVGAAMLCFDQGDLLRARMQVTRALELARAGVDLLDTARAEDLAARVHHACGNFDDAQTLFNSAIGRFKAVSAHWGVASALIGLARVFVAAGDADRAGHLLDEAAPGLDSAGPWFVSRALYVRAIMAVQRGAAREAVALVRDSLTLVRDLRDKYAFAFTLVPLATAACLQGDDRWAAQILGARDVISERTGATIVLKMVHDLHAQAERDVRARLGEEQWSVAYAAGRKTSIDLLLAQIDKRVGESL
jgi:predicted ATPase/DNA-binding XRE family transcriptional regulator